MFELSFAYRLFRKNTLINVVSAVLIGVCIFAFALVGAAVGEVEHARARCGELADATAVYYNEYYSLSMTYKQYEVLDRLSGVTDVLGLKYISTVHAGMPYSLQAVSDRMFRSMPLELKSGKWPSDEDDSLGIPVVVSSNSGLKVGDLAEIAIGQTGQTALKLRVCGILSDGATIYGFHGYSIPMTFGSFFEEQTTTSTVEVFFSDKFLTGRESENLFKMSGSLLIVFDKNLSPAAFSAEVEKLEAYGKVFTFDEIRKNTMLKEQEYKNLFMPSVSVLSLMAVCSSLAAVLITVKKSEKHLRIMKLIGASPLKVAVTMEFLSVIMAVIAVFVSFLLWKMGTAFLMLSGSAVNVCYVKSVFGVLAAYLLAQTALVAAISQKGVKQIELGGREE
mgnify:FL=1